MSSIPVSDPDLGDFVLTITDGQTPLWYGNYQTGKLSVYKPEIYGTVTIPCFAMIAVIQEDWLEGDIVVYAMFTIQTLADAAVDYMKSKIDMVYGAKVLATRVIKNASLH